MEILASNYVPLFYVYSAHYGEGRASVPVLGAKPSTPIFPRRGRAAEDGTAAYSIDNLHILDVLIGRLEA